MSCKTTEQLKSAKTLTAIIYAMYAASFLVGVIWFIAIIMNYVKRDDVTGTYLESHFRWQIEPSGSPCFGQQQVFSCPT